MAETFEEWAILELMGHRKLAGLVREVTLAGGAFIRIDVPAKDPGKWMTTQFYSPASVYCMTPVSEELARQVAQTYEPQPVTRYELPAPAPAPARINDRDNDSSMEAEDDELEDDEIPV